LANIEAKEKEDTINRTRIEWVRNEDGTQGYTINPVKGLCPVDCKDNQGKSYCYARAMYKRFKWNTEIRYQSGWIQEISTIKKPSKIFIGSTMELFGSWINERWWHFINAAILSYPEHTFIFLTKQPQNLIKWSPFPDNCWVGISADTKKRMAEGYTHLCNIEAKVKYISFEPLLERMDVNNLASIQWVIIGQKTPMNVKTAPKMAWIQEILVAASNAENIPVFMKNNLEPLLVGQWAGWKLRQEFPV